MLSLETIFLGLLVVLLLVVVSLGFSIKATLNRLEIRLAKSAATKEPSVKSSDSADDSGGQTPFEAFLAEDPGRLALSKSEQAAAFREWRRNKGMNWSNS